MATETVKEIQRRVSSDLEFCKGKGLEIATGNLFDQSGAGSTFYASKLARHRSGWADATVPRETDALVLCRELLIRVLREELGAIFSAEGNFIGWVSTRHEASALRRVRLVDIKAEISELETRLCRIRDPTPERHEEAKRRLEHAKHLGSVRRAQLDEEEKAAERAYAVAIEQANKERPSPEEIERKRAPIQAKLAEAQALLARRNALRRPRAAGKKARAKAAAGRAAKKARKEEDTDTDMSVSD